MWVSATVRSEYIFIGRRTNPLSTSERTLILGSIAVPAPAIALALTVPGARRRPCGLQRISSQSSVGVWQ